MKRSFGMPLGLVRVGVCLCLAGCGARDSREARGSRSVVSAASDQTTVLATLPDDGPSSPSAPPSGLGLHASSAGAEREVVFSQRGGGVAHVVEGADGLRVVHNGRAGEPYAAVGEVVLSADGRRCAYGALRGGKWRMVVDGKEGAPFSTVKLPVFSPDGAHVAYQAMAGERWHLVVDRAVDDGTRTRYLAHAFSADSSRIAYVDDVGDRELGRLVVSDLAFKEQTVVAAGVSGIVSNAEGSRMAAVSTVDGRQKVVVFGLDRPDRAKPGPPLDAVYDVSFGPDGVSLACVVERSGKRFVVLDEAEEPVPPGVHLVGPLVIPPGKREVGVLVASGGSVLLRHFFAGGQGEGRYDEADGLVYSCDGGSHAYAARRGESWFIVVNGKEGPPFDRVVSPVFSPDGKVLVYRARKSGRRFVVSADGSGRTLRQHAPYEQVFPVGFTADGRSIAYGVQDGRQLAWKVEAP
jgi:WD40 repeat protein